MDDRVVLVVSSWTFAGTAAVLTPGAELALASADRARQPGPAVTVA
jgi:hypothetical protein